MKVDNVSLNGIIQNLKIMFVLKLDLRLKFSLIFTFKLDLTCVRVSKSRHCALFRDESMDVEKLKLGFFFFKLWIIIDTMCILPQFFLSDNLLEI